MSKTRAAAFHLWGAGARATRSTASAMRSVAAELPAVTTGRPRCAVVVLGALLACALVGCAGSQPVSSPSSPATSVAIDEAHTHVDVLFARDIIEHSAQAIALSDLLIGKHDAAPQIVAVARQITASSTRRSNELQSLLQDWGFAPMTVNSVPPTPTPGDPAQPDEHPLASDTDFRRLRDALGSRAADVFVELMIRQSQYVISAARDQLQSGMHPEAMAMARSLLADLPGEISQMQRLIR